MPSLAESDAAFFRNQPVESEPLPVTSARCPECGGSLCWDGSDGLGGVYWACESYRCPKLFVPAPARVGLYRLDWGLVDGSA